jgi:hypothetical protein
MNTENHIMKYLENLLGYLLKSGQAEKHPWFQKGWIIGTYLWGAWLWGAFLSWGKFPIHFHDWAEVNIARLAYLRDAILKGSLPLHASEIAHLRNGTDQILSVPDLVLSPQILLLRWMNVEFFVLINTFILYTVAFISFLWILHRYNLSPLIFSALVLMFNFNGHIISHFSIGHVTWWSYFLFPWLFIMIIRLLEDNDHSWRWVTLTSFLILFIFLQGGYHHYVWSLMFLGILALVAWKHSWIIFKVLIFSNLFSMIRLLPPAPLIENLESEFISGYPKLEYVFSSILFMRQPENSLPFLNFGSNLGYWEFDLFIGRAGALILAFGFIIWLVNLKKNSSLIFTLVPLLVLSVLSIGNLYEPFTNLPIPLIAGERVASRFIILPFVFAMIFSLTALQKWINSLNKPIIVYVITLTLIIYFAIEIFVNTMSWKIENVFTHFPYTPVDKSIKVIANHSDPTYTNMLILGFIITIVSITVLLLLSIKEKLYEKKDLIENTV